MFPKRIGDLAFTLGILSVTSIFLLRWGSAGLSLAIWLILLPLYIFRLITWSNWDFWKRKIYFHATPGIWKGIVFTLWITCGIIFFWLQEIFSIHVLSFYPILTVAGFLISLIGLGITMWVLWLLGIERAVLTTLIFGENEPAQKKIIKHGPYSITPHPMFFGESMIILGTFFFSGEVSLIILFFISLTANKVAARGEERDLIKRAGKEYKQYLKERKLLMSQRDRN